MIIVNVPDKSLVWSNHVFVSPSLKYDKIELKGFVLDCRAHIDLAPQQIALNSIQRRFLKCSSGDDIEIKEWRQTSFVDDLKTAECMIMTVRPWKSVIATLDYDELCYQIRSRFCGQIFRNHQMILTESDGATLYLEVQKGNGTINNDTLIDLQSDKIKLIGKSKINDVDVRQLGIGGLSHQFEQLLRRAFASRTVERKSFLALGIKHVKGILLYGPPGTGKTLLARKLGEMLGCNQPKIVNGPEVLNKYVGESEKNIRELFQEAEVAQQNGDPDIHVIIFDEIDAICRSRGSMLSSTGVNDSIVNQLLTKIDGVNALDNILVIGLTNRMDLLDAALLRPGRLEVQIEISLPDSSGRHEIFQIHSQKMKENGLLHEDIDLDMIIEKTKNFTGAEMEGLIKTAASHALTRAKNAEKLCVTMADFLTGLQEIQPSFASCSIRDDWTEINKTTLGLDHVRDILSETCDNKMCHRLLICADLDSQVRDENQLTAEYIAHHYKPAFVKIIRATDMISLSEQTTPAHILSQFQKARRAPHGVIILEDIELLVRYCQTGPVFSNVILYTLKCLLRKCSRQSDDMLIIGTTSDSNAIKQLQLVSFFNHQIKPLSLSQSIDTT